MKAIHVKYNMMIDLTVGQHAAHVWKPEQAHQLLALQFYALQNVKLHVARHTRPCCHTCYGGHKSMIHWHADHDNVMDLQVQ